MKIFFSCSRTIYVNLIVYILYNWKFPFDSQIKILNIHTHPLALCTHTHTYAFAFNLSLSLYNDSNDFFL